MTEHVSASSSSSDRWSALGVLGGASGVVSAAMRVSCAARQGSDLFWVVGAEGEIFSPRKLLGALYQPYFSVKSSRWCARVEPQGPSPMFSRASVSVRGRAWTIHSPVEIPSPFGLSSEILRWL